MRLLLNKILRILAKRVINRYKPIVIGITGSVGKTTAREAVYAVLSSQFTVRQNKKNYNNELGVPMTVLNIDPEIFGFIARLRLAVDILRAGYLAFGIKQDYPKILVLELAADKPGDIAYLVDMVRPQIGIVTAIGSVPVHVEFYANSAALAREKAELIRALPTDGLAILNYDDQTVLDMGAISKAPVSTFGLSGGNIQAKDIAYTLNKDKQSIGGLAFTLNTTNGSAPAHAHIDNIIGQQQLYGVLPAVAVGLHLGMYLVNIISAFERIDFPHGRMKLMPGISNSIIIDDTYNAAPLSMHRALDTLRDFGRASIELRAKGRRIAILGDMRELGKYTQSAHQDIGAFVAAECADILITVGSLGGYIAQGAQTMMSSDSIKAFSTAEEAVKALPQMIQEGDIVLVKGSQAVRLEKIVKKLMAQPEKAEELLVRQTREWRT